MMQLRAMCPVARLGIYERRGGERTHDCSAMATIHILTISRTVCDLGRVKLGVRGEGEREVQDEEKQEKDVEL